MLVFGEPYETSQGTVLITVTRQARRGGPGRAVGLYTVNADGVTWTPAVDQGRISLVAACTGLVAAAFSTLAMVLRPPWPNLTERAMIAQAESAKHRR
ncbi:hypothetical protein [Amycolatopsis orientalis]|uniref:hypothetical protein n=1 Tax=Amycolatopsis orientalis TaxID=31958 RepID=UPI00039F89D6|nr:hypothetical protein [Amycolatopsis orientalis]